MEFKDLNIRDIGNTIQITGFVLSGHGENLVVHFPGDGPVGRAEPYLPLEMDTADWEKFLYQSDVLAVEITDGNKKAVVRKSQRQIDQAVAWAVFKRDGYLCRYCGGERPLTVDHVILWEQGGATVEANLISACRRCNRTRGNMDFETWMASEEYGKILAVARVEFGLAAVARMTERNTAVIDELPELMKLKVAKQRSR